MVFVSGDYVAEIVPMLDIRTYRIKYVTIVTDNRKEGILASADWDDLNVAMVESEKIVDALARDERAKRQIA